MTEPVADPAAPQWVWTDEVREATYWGMRRLAEHEAGMTFGVPDRERHEHTLILRDAMLDALAPYMAQMVADLTAEAQAEQAALRGQVDAVRADVSIVLGQRRHLHTRPSVWDDANPPEYAGTPCDECRAWDRLERFANAAANAAVWAGEPGGTAPWGVQD
jgi:hypothetical protein